MKTICLVGKSGSGKTTIALELEKLGYKVLDSYTTRPPRHENEKGHIFVGDEEFDAIRGDLVAYTLFSGYEYGATRQQFDECDIYVIDPVGVKELSKTVGRENFCVVYIHTLEGIRYLRMREQRGPSEAFKRVTHDEVAFNDFHDFDLVVENNFKADLENNVTRIKDLIEYLKVNDSE